MKFYLDTEFIEGTQKGKNFFRTPTPPTIDLISIGIVGEDGSQYYAVSKEFNLNEAWNRYDLKLDYGDMRNQYPNGRRHYWLRENVLYKIFWEWYVKENGNAEFGNLNNFVHHMERSHKGYIEFRKLLKKYGKTREQIAQEVKEFCGYKIANQFVPDYAEGKDFFMRKHPKSDGRLLNVCIDAPEFYAYYSAYDWVVFCWLFGRMIDLPEGWPMYCRDIKQDMDYYILKTWNNVADSTWGHTGATLEQLKKHPRYPKNENEHHALSDAKFDRNLHKFLTSL